jgi:hypothetical protein
MFLLFLEAALELCWTLMRVSARRELTIDAKAAAFNNKPSNIQAQQPISHMLKAKPVGSGKTARDAGLFNSI